MNNANANDLPNVPAAIDDWPFYTNLLGCRLDFGTTEDVKKQFRLQRRMLLLQLKLMGDTKCMACGGRAHRARDCPTNMRLGMLGSSNFEWQKLIAWTRKQTVKLDAERLAGLVALPTHHMVPKVHGKKRTYAMAFGK